MGYGKTTQQNSSPNKDNSTKSSNVSEGNTTTSNEKSRKVTFQESQDSARPATPTQTTTQGGSSGRQIAPGLLLVQPQDNNKSFTTSNKLGISPQTTATIAKELLNAGTSPTADAIVVKNNGNNNQTSSPPSPAKTSPTSTSDVVRPKDQLMYLAHLLDFQVSYKFNFWINFLLNYSFLLKY